MSNSNFKDDEGVIDKTKRYGQEGVDKTKELAQRGIDNVKESEFPENVKNKTHQLWEDTKSGAISVKDKIGEVI